MTNKYTDVAITVNGIGSPYIFSDANRKNAGATAAAQLLAGQDIDAVTIPEDEAVYETEVIIPYHAIIEGQIVRVEGEELDELFDDLCDEGGEVIPPR